MPIFQSIHRLHAVVIQHDTVLCLFLKSKTMTWFAKWKTENTQSFLSKFWKSNQISVRLTICEPWSNQTSNPRELQYTSFLLALAYHDRATFETVWTASPSTTEFFLLVKYGLEVPLRFVFCLKLQKDLRTVLVQCSNWLLTWTGTKRFR